MSISTGTATSIQFQMGSSEIDSDGFICSSDFTQLIYQFADILDNEGLAKSTCRAYVSDAHQFVDWIITIGSRHSYDQPELAKNYISFLCKSNRNNTSLHQHPYSVSTIRRRICGATKFMKYLVDIELIPANPFEVIPKMSLEQLRGDSKIQIIPKGKILDLIAFCDLSTAVGLRNRVLLLGIVGVGLSVSELHHLDVNDFNLEDHSLTVLGRGGRSRVIPLPHPLIDTFQSWIATRNLFASDCEAVLISLHRTPSRGKPGKRLSCRSIRIIVDRHLEMVGSKAPGVSCHALRKSAIIHNFINGADFTGIRSMFGLTPKTIRAYQEYASEICNRVHEREND